MIQGKKFFKSSIQTYIQTSLKTKTTEDISFFRSYMIASFRLRMLYFINGQLKESQSPKVKETNRKRLHQKFPFLSESEVEEVLQLVPHKLMLIEQDLMMEEIAREQTQVQQRIQDEAQLARRRSNGGLHNMQLPLII